MDIQRINEINAMKYVSCAGIEEKNGVLCICLNGTYLKPVDLDDESYSDNTMKKVSDILDKDTKEIVADESIIYKIIFRSYISYHILNESYSASGNDEFIYGNLFRKYTKSSYLMFIEDSTYASSFANTYAHYGIICLDQIIDVISEEEPQIIKQLKITKT